MEALKRKWQSLKTQTQVQLTNDFIIGKLYFNASDILKVSSK